jgi:hypothetical protein
MFRYLDSNQDNRIQSSASCQLLNTGLEATDISGMRYLLLTPEYRSRRSGAKHWAEHGDSSPTFDPAVEIAAPPDVDPQAPAVALSNVLTHGLRVMALQRGTAKLAGLRVRGVQPEPLGRLNVCGLVYVDAKHQVLTCDACRVQEPEEEPDQRWIAVNEDHSIKAAMRLALGAFAPLGDGARDEDLAVRHVADLGGGSRCHAREACLADGAFGFPVSSGALGGTPPALLNAEPWWPREVSHPQGDRTLGDAKAGRDLFVVKPEVPEPPGRCPDFVFGIGTTCPVGWGNSSKEVVQRHVAHRAENCLYLPAGLALAPEGDCSLAQTIKLFFSSHTRILGRASDIRACLRGYRRLAVAGGGGS